MFDNYEIVLSQSPYACKSAITFNNSQWSSLSDKEKVTSQNTVCNEARWQCLITFLIQMHFRQEQALCLHRSTLENICQRGLRSGGEGQSFSATSPLKFQESVDFFLPSKNDGSRLLSQLEQFHWTVNRQCLKTCHWASPSEASKQQWKYRLRAGEINKPSLCTPPADKHRHSCYKSCCTRCFPMAQKDKACPKFLPDCMHNRVGCTWHQVGPAAIGPQAQQPCHQPTGIVATVGQERAEGHFAAPSMRGWNSSLDINCQFHRKWLIFLFKQHPGKEVFCWPVIKGNERWEKINQICFLSILVYPTLAPHAMINFQAK